MRKPITLIVNADDYGYFSCISRGILDAAESGKLTATGILSNSPNLKVQLEWLDAIKGLSVGVHLNLTHRHPLSETMMDKFGCFPSAYVMSLLILKGQIRIDDVRTEWRAQIEACQGRQLMFLNSHEHIHMLPALFKLTLELAQEYQIPYVRLTHAEWLWPLEATALIRNALIYGMEKINHGRLKTQTPELVGLSQSGKLDLNYLARIFSRMEPGKTYELMCHPGYFDSEEISDPKLVAYHDWETELSLLQSQKLQDLYEKFGISVGYYQN